MSSDGESTAVPILPRATAPPTVQVSVTTDDRRHNSRNNSINQVGNNDQLCKYLKNSHKNAIAASNF